MATTETTSAATHDKAKLGERMIERAAEARMHGEHSGTFEHRGQAMLAQARAAELNKEILAANQDSADARYRKDMGEPVKTARKGESEPRGSAGGTSTSTSSTGSAAQAGGTASSPRR